MLNYYQPFLLPFLKLKKNHTQTGVRWHYYHSFEDGLWDLLNNKFPLNKKLTVLVPDFYCSDVLDNIKNRGHKYIYYPLDADFQIPISKFKKYLSTFAPDVVIVLHACGITSQLFVDSSWLAELPNNSLIIEDSVHRLVNPTQINLLNDRHFIIDSLRKVSPLPGSRMFGTHLGLSFSQSTAKLSVYLFSSLFYFTLFRIVLVTGFIFNSSTLVTYAHNYLLKSHDDIIGDSIIPHSGTNIFLPLINRFNYKKIYQIKREQVELYDKYLSAKLPGVDPSWSKRGEGEISFGDLHVYPLVINSPPSQLLGSYLDRYQIPVWYKFTDTPWSQDKSVLFLPLGFHIKEKEIKYVCELLNNYFTNNY